MPEGGMRVQERMKTDLTTVTPLDSVRTAWALLRAHKIRHLPVVEQHRLVGLVTDRDIRLVFPSAVVGQQEQDAHEALEKVLVREIMSQPVLTVSPTDTIADAARLLLEKRVTGLPVVEGERLVGIITVIDVLEAFVEVMEGKVSG
ncbi:MAG: CBS domain-containing protein [Candidatus Methylomirabilales bacterium]